MACQGRRKSSSLCRHCLYRSSLCTHYRKEFRCAGNDDSNSRRDGAAAVAKTEAVARSALGAAVAVPASAAASAAIAAPKRDLPVRPCSRFRPSMTCSRLLAPAGRARQTTRRECARPTPFSSPRATNSKRQVFGNATAAPVSSPCDGGTALSALVVCMDSTNNGVPKCR